VHPQLQDGIPMRGDLCVIVRDAATGTRLRRFEIRNKITFGAADVLVELLAQRELTDPEPRAGQIYSLRMGTSNTPASRADTNLGAFAIGKRLGVVDKITGIPGELQFVATLEAGDANGLTLQEAGLFTRGARDAASETDAPGATPGDVRMFARQVHPPIPKTPAITLEYSWRLAFTA
jgi:hypothetical protein